MFNGDSVIAWVSMGFPFLSNILLPTLWSNYNLISEMTVIYLGKNGLLLSLVQKNRSVMFRFY